jgi:hypothetical protein
MPMISSITSLSLRVRRQLRNDEVARDLGERRMDHQ